jgi:Heparinase II/III-like protein
VLIVDDQSFRWRDRGPYGSGLLAFGQGDGWYAVLGHNPHLEGASHRRLLLYRPGELVVVVDEVEAIRPHTIDRRLHFGPDLVAARTDGVVVASDQKGRPLATLIEASREPVEISLARGVEEPRMDGWTFPRDLTKVPSDAVTLRTRVASGLLVHVIVLTEAVPERIAARRPRRRRRLLRRLRRGEDEGITVEIGNVELQVTQSGRHLMIEGVDRT